MCVGAGKASLQATAVVNVIEFRRFWLRSADVPGVRWRLDPASDRESLITHVGEARGTELINMLVMMVAPTTTYLAR